MAASTGHDDRHDEQHDDGTAKVAALLADERIAMLTTRAPDGTLTSRPMALQDERVDL